MDDLSATARALKSKSDKNECNGFVEDYKPFILAHTARVLKKSYVDQSSDYFSQALAAFYEAIVKFDPEKGSFLNYARFIIEKRLISYLRTTLKESERLVEPYVYDEATGEEEDFYFRKKSLENYAYNEEAENLEAEIRELIKALGDFGGITLEEAYADCPKNNATRLQAREIINCILCDDGIVGHIVSKKYLPLKLIAQKYNIRYSKLKNMRRYVIACVIIALGDYPHLQEYMPIDKENYRNAFPEEA